MSKVLEIGMSKINRHAGGLEIPPKTHQLVSVINRHAGGLEMHPKDHK